MKNPQQDLEPVETPQLVEFDCKFTMMDTVPTDNLVGAAGTTKCALKVKAENNKQVTELVVDTITIKLTSLS